MRNSQYYSIHVFDRTDIRKLYPIQALSFFSICFRIRYKWTYSKIFQFIYYINDFRISCIRTVLFKCKSQNRNSGTLNRYILFDQILHKTLRHVLTHIVIDPAAGQYDL